MNNILLIDDDEKFKLAFQVTTQAKGLSLIHKKSFAGLQEIMPKYHYAIAAVVLDIKCLMQDDQHKEDEGFIGAATKYLDVNFPGFPRIILTGDDDAFNGYKKFTSNEDVFQKTPDGIKGAVEKLIHLAENSQTLTLKRANLKVFELFETGLFNSTAEKTLIHILSNLEESNFAKYGGIFRDIRALQETIYKTINAKNKTVIPDIMFQPNGMVRFNQLMTHLSGYPDRNFKPTTTVYQNSAVDNLANTVYWTCGKYIHADPKEIYLVSNYTLKSVAFAVMELFLWSKIFLKKNR
jgi:hypothetical protein